MEDLYSKNGRPSSDQLFLFKMAFIQYIFGIRSMRQTIKEIETNMAYRRFLGFGFHSEAPHFSTFGQNYVRCFQDTDVFEEIFYRILKEIMDKGFLSADHVLKKLIQRHIWESYVEEAEHLRLHMILNKFRPNAKKRLNVSLLM